MQSDLMKSHCRLVAAAASDDASSTIAMVLRRAWMPGGTH